MSSNASIAPLFLDDDAIERGTPWAELIAVLHKSFRQPTAAPARQHLGLAPHAAEGPALLLMPAWDEEMSGVKLLTFTPNNAKSDRPVLQGLYILCSSTTGAVLALLDAQSLTGRRTAATSALASSFLSRRDSRRLLVVGTGHLAPFMAAAHASIRPIDHIDVWGRDPHKSTLLAQRLQKELKISTQPVRQLREALKFADIVTSATSSREPLLLGNEVRAGTHVDLVGAFSANMREADAALLSRSLVYVDQREAALRESGELIDAIASGMITPAHLQGELRDLCTSTAPAIRTAEDITVFKSVGLALEDLAAAKLAFNKWLRRDLIEPRRVAERN